MDTLKVNLGRSPRSSGSISCKFCFGMAQHNITTCSASTFNVVQHFQKILGLVKMEHQAHMGVIASAEGAGGIRMLLCSPETHEEY